MLEIPWSPVLILPPAPAEPGEWVCSICHHPVEIRSGIHGACLLHALLPIAGPRKNLLGGEHTLTVKGRSGARSRRRRHG